MKFLSCILYGCILGHFLVRTKRLLLAGSATMRKWVVFARFVESGADRLFKVGVTTNYTKACRAVEDLDAGDYFIGEVAEMDVTPEYLDERVHNWSELTAGAQDELYLAQGVLL